MGSGPSVSLSSPVLSLLASTKIAPSSCPVGREFNLSSLCWASPALTTKISPGSTPNSPASFIDSLVIITSFERVFLKSWITDTVKFLQVKNSNGSPRPDVNMYPIVITVIRGFP